MRADLESHGRQKELAHQSYFEHLEEASKHLQLQAEFGLSALKNAVLVNGGATIALMTLVGSDSATLEHSSLVNSIGSFAIGLVLAMLGMVSASTSQSYFFAYWKGLAWESQATANGMKVEAADRKDLKRGNTFLFVANSGAVFSIGSFVLGAIFGVGGLK